MTEAGQVIRHTRPREVVVICNAHGKGIRRNPVEIKQFVPGCRRQRNRIRIRETGEHQHRERIICHQHIQALLHFVNMFTGDKHQRQIILAQILGDAVENLVIECRTDPRHQDANDAAFLADQAPGERVGLVTHFLGAVQHDFPRAVRDWRTFLKGAADRGNRHAEILGKILDRHTRPAFWGFVFTSHPAPIQRQLQIRQMFNGMTLRLPILVSNAILVQPLSYGAAPVPGRRNPKGPRRRIRERHRPDGRLRAMPVSKPK